MALNRVRFLRFSPEIKGLKFVTSIGNNNNDPYKNITGNAAIELSFLDVDIKKTTLIGAEFKSEVEHLFKAMQTYLEDKHHYTVRIDYPPPLDPEYKVLEGYALPNFIIPVKDASEGTEQEVLPHLKAAFAHGIKVLKGEHQRAVLRERTHQNISNLDLVADILKAYKGLKLDAKIKKEITKRLSHSLFPVHDSLEKPFSSSRTEWGKEGFTHKLPGINLGVTFLPENHACWLEVEYVVDQSTSTVLRSSIVPVGESFMKKMRNAMIKVGFKEDVEITRMNNEWNKVPLISHYDPPPSIAFNEIPTEPLQQLKVILPEVLTSMDEEYRQNKASQQQQAQNKAATKITRLLRPYPHTIMDDKSLHSLTAKVVKEMTSLSVV